MGHGYGRFLGASPFGDAPEPHLHPRALGPRRRQGCLDEGRFQSRVSLAGLGVAVFAGGLIVAGARPAEGSTRAATSSEPDAAAVVVSTGRETASAVVEVVGQAAADAGADGGGAADAEGQAGGERGRTGGRAVEQVVPRQRPRGGDGGTDAGQGEGAAEERDPPGRAG